MNCISWIKTNMNYGHGEPINQSNLEKKKEKKLQANYINAR